MTKSRSSVYTHTALTVTQLKANHKCAVYSTCIISVQIIRNIYHIHTIDLQSHVR
jgi:hypothetical protein